MFFSFGRKIKVFCLIKIIFLIIFFFFWSTTLKAQTLIVIEKSSRILYLYRKNRLFKAYPCSLGWNPVGPKHEKGDGATPEGLYKILQKRTSKKYFLFLELSYPNLKDIQRAYWEGRINKEEYIDYCKNLKQEILSGPLGNSIGIHGGGLFRARNGHWVRDWTHGCIALENKDIKEIYKYVSIGTPVFIYDASRSIFETFSQLITFPVKETLSFLRELPWEGEFEMLWPDLYLKIFLKEGHSGAKKMWFWGYNPWKGNLIFCLKDLNGNGSLDPLDQLKFFTSKDYWSYKQIQEKILHFLPQWIILQKKGGDSY